MGKASKKVRKQVKKKVDEKNLQQCQPLEMELMMAFEREEYAEVLNILSQLITAKDIKPDFLYRGAYSYFMLGDHERAAQWINNTLSYAPDHVDARILLARLCFMQGRDDDGLAIYEFLIENYQSVMTAEQKEQIMDSSEYYVRRESEKLRQNYSRLADFLQVGKQEKPVTVQSDVQAKTEGGTAGTLSALQRLKDKLHAIQAKDYAENAAEPEQDEVDKQIADIDSKDCSLREKVQLLNKFAAAQYMADKNQQAEKLLKAALLKDDGDSQTLRNMAMVQAALGNWDKAQAFAANLPEVDFVFLHLLKQQEN